MKGPSTDKTTRKLTKNEILLVKREKHEHTSYFRHDKILFLNNPLDEYSLDTSYLKDCSEKKMCLKTFFLREISSAALTTMVYGLWVCVSKVLAWDFGHIVLDGCMQKLSCACRRHVGRMLATRDKFAKFGRQGSDTRLLSDFFWLFPRIFMSGNGNISIVTPKYFTTIIYQQ